MSAKTIRRVLFWASIAAWTFGWVIAIAQQQGSLSPAAAGGAVMLWVIGAVSGTLWLILALIKLAARTWHAEKTGSTT